MSTEDYNQAIEQYRLKWAKLVPTSRNKELFESLTPTALGWKVAELSEHDHILSVWRDKCDQIHSKWMNGRWISVMYLREGHELAWNIRTLKVLQRRPGSSDVPGLDHIDFYGAEVTAAKQKLLADEPNLNTTDEENGPCRWVSVWFDDTEAKLRNATTLGVCATELLEAEEEVKASAGSKNKR